MVECKERTSPVAASVKSGVQSPASPDDRVNRNDEEVKSPQQDTTAAKQNDDDDLSANNEEETPEATIMRTEVAVAIKDTA